MKRLFQFLFVLVVLTSVTFMILGAGLQNSRADLRAKAAKNMATLAVCVIVYANDYDEVLPHRFSTQADLKSVVERKDTRPDQMMRQSILRKVAMLKSLNPNGGKILPNSKLAGATVYTMPDPSSTVSVYDSKKWPEGDQLKGFLSTKSKFVK